ncbi:MAG TPA: DUF222 domain-containing protein, partial [Nocardioidaceae bacterium]|nr:DUF222 domain-containing protein [Nocardioidaceae bacterium]
MDTPSPITTPAAVVEDARARILELGELLWSAKPAGDLLAVVRSIESMKSTLEAVELSVVNEIDATKAAGTDQYASAKDFVTAVAGTRRGAGSGQVRLARAVCTDYRDTHTALADGWLSRDKARVIVRTLDRLPVKPSLRAAGEKVLLEEATRLCVEDLET